MLDHLLAFAQDPFQNQQAQESGEHGGGVPERKRGVGIEGDGLGCRQAFHHLGGECRWGEELAARGAGGEIAFSNKTFRQRGLLGGAGACHRKARSGQTAGQRAFPALRQRIGQRLVFDRINQSI